MTERFDHAAYSGAFSILKTGGYVKVYQRPRDTIVASAILPGTIDVYRTEGLNMETFEQLKKALKLKPKRGASAPLDRLVATISI